VSCNTATTNREPLKRSLGRADSQGRWTVALQHVKSDAAESGNVEERDAELKDGHLVLSVITCQLRCCRTWRS